MHVEGRRSARDATVVLHHDHKRFEKPQRGTVPCNFCSQLRLCDGITGRTQRVVKGRLDSWLKGTLEEPQSTAETHVGQQLLSRGRTQQSGWTTPECFRS